jgi:nucleoside-diphosphate-sugar epimerase
MKRVLVTGGGGFLGRRIVELHLERGDDVAFVARHRYPEVEALGARGHVADLADGTRLPALFAGHDVVHHVAGKAGYWGPRAEFVAGNVTATEHVLSACRDASVPRLVYTSTPSVVGYARDAGGIAHAPYPSRWESVYGETKARAEQLVLAANGAPLANGGRLATVALRPHLVIGPRDPHLLPRVLERARAGTLVAVGSRKNVVDLTYVDNAAYAHLDAAEALDGPGAACAGQPYFVTNGEPVRLWPWVDELLRALDLPPVRRRIPLPVATAAGAILESVYSALRIRGEPRITRFLAAALARGHWYDPEPARRDLGYVPRVPLAEGTRRTVEWFRSEAPAASVPPGRMEVR